MWEGGAMMTTEALISRPAFILSHTHTHTALRLLISRSQPLWLFPGLLLSNQNPHHHPPPPRDPL